RATSRKETASIARQTTVLTTPTRLRALLRHRLPSSLVASAPRSSVQAAPRPSARGAPETHDRSLSGQGSAMTRERDQMTEQVNASAAGTIDVGGDLTVARMGFGAMRVTGTGIWGNPPDHETALATLRLVVELGVNFIDTADSYGPEVSENL